MSHSTSGTPTISDEVNMWHMKSCRCAMLIWLWLSSVSLVVAEERLSTQFETETVTASPKQSHDNIRIRLPSGAMADIGILYEGGDAQDRIARVIPEPTHVENHVLHFWLKHARAKGQRPGHEKGRIQMNLAGINLHEAYQRCRVYLHPDLKLYRTFAGQNTWFTINELWFGAEWEHADNTFRISLNIGKEKGIDNPLRFVASGAVGQETKWKDVWTSINQQFEVPIGEWFDLAVGYRQGDKSTGRFYVAVKRASDAAMTVVIDVRDWTYHPQARVPVPLTHWNPLKIYTSSAIIDHVRENGGVVQAYWDNLEIFDQWPQVTGLGNGE